MTTVDQSDPQWLQDLLERAIAEGWCTRINCTTCASEPLRQALRLLETHPSERPRFLPMGPDAAMAIVAGLKVCSQPIWASIQLEEAVIWVLYEVWRNFGDQYFSALNATWAGEVLARMHHQRRQEARRIHEARQSVRQRDWKE